MGVAIAQGISLPAAAGAVVAGSVFGDKLSPFSDTTILAPIAAGSELYEHIKHMLYTTGAATIVSLIVYLIAGLSTPVSSVTSPEKVQLMLSTLDTMFNWNILLLLPPVIVFYGAYRKKPTIPVMLLSSTIASIMGMLFQRFTITDVFDAVVVGFNVSMVRVQGFDSANVMSEIATLLNRGGMMGMMSTVLLILCSFVFAGIISKAGCMEIILEKMKDRIRSTGDLVRSTVLSTILMSIVTGSSYLAILIPGEMFRDLYKARGLHAKNLSRTLEDSGTCVVPLVPWSIAGTYMATTLGVPTLEYIPWAILCYTSFIFAIIFGYTGFGIAKLEDK